MPTLRYTRPRPPVRRDLQKGIDAILTGPGAAPEEDLIYQRHDDLAHAVRTLAGEGRTDADIASRTGIRSLDRVRQLREHLGCDPDPEQPEAWDQLADDGTPPEVA